jgi:hydroxyacylglutathione hydrolase
MNVYPIPVGRLQTNSYIIQKDNVCLVIDPGDEAEKITSFLNEKSIKPDYLLATHGHFDHVGAVNDLKKKFPETKFYLSKHDVQLIKKSDMIAPLFGCRPLVNLPKIDDFLEHFSLPEMTLIASPGHSPGGVVFFFKEENPPILFSGDTLFKNCVGRYDFLLGDKNQLTESLKKIVKLPSETIVYPGHGESFQLSKSFGFLLKLLEEWSQSDKL